MRYDDGCAREGERGEDDDRACAASDDPGDIARIDRVGDAVGGEDGGDGYDNDNEEEEHLPAGQHLLVDIKNVDGTFLDSEERLDSAMLHLVDASRLTLLSYHCHGMSPAGVSCVGVLLESHISFHTWPEEGVITLDLFTCGPNPLLPSLGDIERLFAVPQPLLNCRRSSDLVYS